MTHKKTIAIVGSRNYPSPPAINYFVSRLKGSPCKILSGGARGVDSIAIQAAKEYGLEWEEILADWEQHGKGAGFLRNTELVKKADIVVAFWDLKSRGTKDTITKAKAWGKELHVFGPDGKLTTV